MLTPPTAAPSPSLIVFFSSRMFLWFFFAILIFVRLLISFAYCFSDRILSLFSFISLSFLKTVFGRSYWKMVVVLWRRHGSWFTFQKSALPSAHQKVRSPPPVFAGCLWETNARLRPCRDSESQTCGVSTPCSLPQPVAGFPRLDALPCSYNAPGGC